MGGPGRLPYMKSGATNTSISQRLRAIRSIRLPCGRRSRALGRSDSACRSLPGGPHSFPSPNGLRTSNSGGAATTSGRSLCPQGPNSFRSVAQDQFGHAYLELTKLMRSRSSYLRHDEVKAKMRVCEKHLGAEEVKIIEELAMLPAPTRE